MYTVPPTRITSTTSKPMSTSIRTSELMAGDGARYLSMRVRLFCAPVAGSNGQMIGNGSPQQMIEPTTASGYLTPLQPATATSINVRSTAPQVGDVPSHLLPAQGMRKALSPILSL